MSLRPCLACLLIAATASGVAAGVTANPVGTDGDALGGVGLPRTHIGEWFPLPSAIGDLTGEPLVEMNVRLYEAVPEGGLPAGVERKDLWFRLCAIRNRGQDDARQVSFCTPHGREGRTASITVVLDPVSGRPYVVIAAEDYRFYVFASSGPSRAPTGDLVREYADALVADLLFGVSAGYRSLNPSDPYSRTCCECEYVDKATGRKVARPTSDVYPHDRRQAVAVIDFLDLLRPVDRSRLAPRRYGSVPVAGAMRVHSLWARDSGGMEAFIRYGGLWLEAEQPGKGAPWELVRWAVAEDVPPPPNNDQ